MPIWQTAPFSVLEMKPFFFPSMITGINHVVQQNDYSLIVFQSDNSIVQERRLVKYCTHLSADGVLLVVGNETSDLQHLAVLGECGIPVADIGRGPQDGDRLVGPPVVV